MPDYKKSIDGVLSYSVTPLTSTSSATAFGTATVFTNAQDVDLKLTKDSQDINSRANNGWKRKVGTLKDGSITVKALWAPADANFAAFKTAWLDGTVLAVWALDGSTTGSQGLAGNFEVLDISRAEPLDGVMTCNIELGAAGYQHWFIKA